MAYTGFQPDNQDDGATMMGNGTSPSNFDIGQ